MSASLVTKFGCIFRSLSSKSGLIRNGPSLKDFVIVGASKTLDNHAVRAPYLAGLDNDGRGNKGLY